MVASGDSGAAVVLAPCREVAVGVVGVTGFFLDCVPLEDFWEFDLGFSFCLGDCIFLGFRFFLFVFLFAGLLAIVVVEAEFAISSKDNFFLFPLILMMLIPGTLVGEDAVVECVVLGDVVEGDSVVVVDVNVVVAVDFGVAAVGVAEDISSVSSDMVASAVTEDLVIGVILFPMSWVYPNVLVTSVTFSGLVG